MKNLFAGAAFAAALATLGGTAFAADAMKADAMMKPDPMMATMLCRPAAAGEKTTAMSAANKPMVCKAIDMDAMMAMKKKIDAMPGGEAVTLKMLQDYHVGAPGSQ